MEQMNIPDCAAFDLNAACTGFIYGLAVANGMLATGVARRALVIGAEALSRFTNWKDRATCVLFGDAAGAAVVGEVEEGRGILSQYLCADGRLNRHIEIPAGGSRQPATAAAIEAGETCVRMNGNDVFKFAVRIMGDALSEAIQRAGLTPEDMDWVIPHQANIRIIESAVKRLGIVRERFVINIDRFGNTSSASIPLALDEAVRAGRIKRGDLVGLVAFGGGLTWGASVLRY
jgi:3-oxoacyl-[acyl-carrier-protein] synthase-3